jgi:hypothetical protein
MAFVQSDVTEAKDTDEALLVGRAPRSQWPKIVRSPLHENQWMPDLAMDQVTTDTGVTQSFG